MHHPNHRIGIMRLWLRSKSDNQQIGECSKLHQGQETRHISHREPDLGSIMSVVLTHLNLITGHVYVSQRPKSSGTSRYPVNVCSADCRPSSETMIVESPQVQDEIVSSFLQLHTSVHKHETPYYLLTFLQNIGIIPVPTSKPGNGYCLTRVPISGPTS